jgi:serine 3-dehydrogenase (NADP+)
VTSTILITGATSGFGQATARKFLANGWQVIGTGRRADRLAEMADGNDAFLPLAFDIQDEAAMDAALASLPARFAGIDVLVNNAGLSLGTGAFHESSLADYRTVVDTNVTALLAVTHKLLPRLIERRGVIVNLSSIAANWPYPGGNVYCGTKAFVQQFSRALRSDLHGRHVRVTSIEPGLCESEFTLVRNGGDQAAYDALYGGANAIQPQDIADTIWWVATLPPHVNINTMEIMPVSQSWNAHRVDRSA